jgi:hypothetical protein
MPACGTPPLTATPGDRWACPGCHRQYIAVDDDADGFTSFHWESVATPPGREPDGR